MLLTITPMAVAQEKKEPVVEKKQEAIRTDKRDELIKQVLTFLNSTTSDQLQEVSGIGEKLSQVIIDGREYESLEKVLAVKGIGEGKLKSIGKDDIMGFAISADNYQDHRYPETTQS